MKNFKGRVAAVTGAASGIGRALALELATRGCHLALCDIDGEGLVATAVRARALGVFVTHSVVDVADRAAVEAWAASTAAAHGKVNLIFNNAGVALSSTMAGVGYEDFEWIMGVNFWGMVHGTKAFLPHLKAAGEGHVVNISSLFGLCAQPGMGAYNASKFAIRGFTESLRQELDIERCGVSATSVHPGGIKTNIARAGRVSPSVEDLLACNAETGAARFEKLFITSAGDAAKTIVKAVQRDARRVLIGPDARLMDWVVRWFPGRHQALIARASLWYMKRG